jgi:hypothetical protein
MKSFYRMSKTWIVLVVFVADATRQLGGGDYHLDPVLAGLVAAVLGLKTWKDIQEQVQTKTEQVG